MKNVKYYIVKAKVPSESQLLINLLPNNIEITEKDLAKFNIILEGEMKWKK